MTAVPSIIYTVCPSNASNARVGVDGMPVHATYKPTYGSLYLLVREHIHFLPCSCPIGIIFLDPGAKVGFLHQREGVSRERVSKQSDSDTLAERSARSSNESPITGQDQRVTDIKPDFDHRSYVLQLVSLTTYCLCQSDGVEIAVWSFARILHSVNQRKVKKTVTCSPIVDLMRG